MRPELLEPYKLTPQVVHDALSLVGVSAIPVLAVAEWTRLEQLLAYDWAMREYLRASGSLIRRRPKPTFITTLEVTFRRAGAMSSTGPGCEMRFRCSF